MKLLTWAWVFLVTAVSCVSTHLLKEKLSRYASKQNRRSSSEEKRLLPRHVTPNSYKLELQPFLNEGYFHGQVHINISCHEPTNIITLHAHRYLRVMLADTAVHSLGSWKEIDGHYDDRTYHSIPIMKLQRNIDKDRCEIILGDYLKQGMMYNLKLKFSGNLIDGEPKSFYHMSYEDQETKEKRWYMATELKDGNARKVFPCFDETSLKANFQISIVRPAKFKAFTTMPLHTTEAIENSTDWEIDRFATTPPMSTESLGIVIFDTTELQPVSPMRMWRSVTIHGYSQAKLRNAFESNMMYQMIRLLQIVEDYLGVTFPLPELHVVATPVFNSTEISNYWGLIMFSESEVETGFVNYQIMNALSSQWVGHMVTPRSTSSRAFSSGLAYYLTYIGLVNIEKNPKYSDMIHWGPALENHIYYKYSKISSINDEHSKEIRSTWLCRMLNYTLTKNIFRTGLEIFLHNRAYNTFEEDDFFGALDDEAWINGILPQFISTYDIAKEWLDNHHFPVVTVTQHYENNTATLSQQTFIMEYPYQTSDTKHTLWWIPIMYMSEDNLNINSLEVAAWMRGTRKLSMSYLPHGDSFVIVNPENIGMFLVNYDQTNWELISEYLMESSLNPEQTQIPPKTRSKLLCDAMYLALSGELNIATALNMSLFARNEKDTSVWKTLIMLYEVVYNELHDISSVTVLEKFGVYVGYLLIPAYKSLQNNKSMGEVNQNIYNSLNLLLSQVGYKPALQEAKIKFNLHMDKDTMSEKRRCAVFQWSDEDWEIGLETAISSSTKDNQRNLISQLISCARKPEKLMRILKILLLDENISFMDEDIRSAFDSIHDFYTFVRFISENWVVVKSRFGINQDMWNFMFEKATQNFKTQEGFDLVSQLYHYHGNELGSAKRIVEDSLITISETMNGQYKFVPQMEDWLDSYQHYNDLNEIASE